MSGVYVLPYGWMADFKPEPYSEREAFLWSIEQASRFPGDERLGIPTLLLGRGEVLASTSRIAKDFGWSGQRVRSFMARMQRDGVWQVRPAGVGRVIITVCDFDRHVPPAGGKVQ